MDKQNKKIEYSIIVPIYNVETYIEQCLESLLKQIDDRVELILLNDGSSDGSKDICEKYVGKYPNIVFVDNSNHGVAYTRNEGIKISKGEYILWVDPDDYVCDDWLETIRSIIDEKHPDMLIFDYYQLKENVLSVRQYKSESGYLTAEQVIYDLTQDYWLTSVLWNKVIRRDCFVRYTFDESLRCLEDYDILYRIVNEQGSIYYEKKPLYVYRICDNGLVRSINLDIGYMSFLKSIERNEEVEKLGHSFSMAGTFLQAKGFLCKYYQSNYPQNYREQYNRCKKYLKNNWRKALKEDIPLVERLKCISIVNPIIGSAYKRNIEKKKNKEKE